MAKCTLRIEIRDGVDHVTPGGELPVTVHVDCDAPTKCNGLVLTRYWETHGRGNKDSGAKRLVQLFEGQWEAGSYSYDAVVPFPETPLTYHGTNVNVDWMLHARADVPLAFDPKAETGVLMVNSAPPRKLDSPGVWAPTPIQLKGALNWAFYPSLVGLAIAATLVITSHPVIATLIGALSAWLLVSSLKAKSTTKAMGHTALGVHPEWSFPGETVRAYVELEPEVSLRVESIKVSLVCGESATSGSGTDSTTYRHEALKDELTLGEHLELDGTHRFEQEVEFNLPVDAPTSFRSNDNSVTYTLTLEIEPTGKSKVKHTQEIQVGGPKERD